MIRAFLPYLVGVLVVASIIWGPRRVWAAWKRFGQAIGDTLARVVMTLFYFTILVPFALISRWSQDPLSAKAADGHLWRSRSAQGEPDLTGAVRQY